jgi:hypothetical protein
VHHVPESQDTSLSGSADWPGALAGVAALATITYAIVILPGRGVRSPEFAAAAVLRGCMTHVTSQQPWRRRGIGVVVAERCPSWIVR